MRFIIETNKTVLAGELAGKLRAELQNHKRVIWLVPGGSNISLSAAVIKQIPAEESRKLVIMQTDERFGLIDHPDSNWLQLRQAGFDTKQATAFPVLTNDSFSLEETAVRYAVNIKQEFETADYIFGQFGIGADGHIAGVLPGSEAASSRKLVSGYEAPNFRRITLTFTALKQLSAGYAVVFGAEKQQALENLAHKSLTLREQPAQILKRLPEAAVYNDCITR